MNMFELFSILFPVDYLKEVLITKKSSKRYDISCSIYLVYWMLVLYGFMVHNFQQVRLVVDNIVKYILRCTLQDK